MSLRTMKVQCISLIAALTSGFVLAWAPQARADANWTLDYNPVDDTLHVLVNNLPNPVVSSDIFGVQRAPDRAEFVDLWATPCASPGCASNVIDLTIVPSGTYMVDLYDLSGPDLSISPTFVVDRSPQIQPSGRPHRIRAPEVAIPYWFAHAVQASSHFWVEATEQLPDGSETPLAEDFPSPNASGGGYSTLTVANDHSRYPIYLTVHSCVNGGACAIVATSAPIRLR